MLEMRQCFRIGQRLRVLHRAAVHHVAHRELDDLAALGARNVLDLQRPSPARGAAWCCARIWCLDLLRSAPRRAPGPRAAGRTARRARRPFQSWPMTSALEHLGQLLDLAVDLRRADAHAAGIEHRVGAAVDDHAAVLGQLDIVAVAPDAREALEIGGVIAFCRRGRSRSRSASTGTGAVQTSSPFCADHRLAVVVVRPRPPCRAPRHWISPRYTGRSGCRARSRKRCRCRRRSRTGSTSRLDLARRRSRSSPAPAASRSTAIVRSVAGHGVARGSSPILAQASMNLAEVPKMGHALGLGEVEQDRCRAGWKGEPS